VWFLVDVPHFSQCQVPQGEVLPKQDTYTQVMVMLESLHLTELFPMFTAAMIKVGFGSFGELPLGHAYN
jgi:hypothetical protein